MEILGCLLKPFFDVDVSVGKYLLLFYGSSRLVNVKNVNVCGTWVPISKYQIMTQQ